MKNKSKLYYLLLFKDTAWLIKKIKFALYYRDALVIRVKYNFKRLIDDWKIKYISDNYNYPHHIVFIAGLPMSATTWVKTMFARVPGYYTRFAPLPYEVAIRQNIEDEYFSYAPNYSYTLFKTHLNPWKENIAILKRNNVDKVIVTFRDYRDVVISLYYRWLQFPGKTTDFYYHDYTQYSKEEAINRIIDMVSSYSVDWVEGWMEVQKANKGMVYICKFENLRKCPETEFRGMLDFYGIKIGDKNIRKIIVETKGGGTMSDNINRGAVLPFALGSNFRSGKIGGWADEFSDLNKQYCKTKLGPALIKAGYETDLMW